MIEERPGGVALHLKVIPRAKRNSLGPAVGGMIKLHITAPPVDDKANQAILRYLAELFQLRKGELRILKGMRSPLKTVFLPVTRETVEKQLETKDD
jgi:uncharacterized protein (TIGR00251 family)